MVERARRHQQTRREHRVRVRIIGLIGTINFSIGNIGYDFNFSVTGKNMFNGAGHFNGHHQDNNTGRQHQDDNSRRGRQRATTSLEINVANGSGAAVRHDGGDDDIRSSSGTR
jgi:hypothetical protein